MESFERTLQLNPQHVGALTNLGNALKDQGRIPEALEHYRAATALQPEHLPSLENVLSTLHYNPDCDLAELHREHTHWDQRFGIPFRAMWKPFDYVLDPERPLRIGLYSNNLGNHPVGHFVRAAFEELDRDQFEIVVYSSRLTLDAERDRFRSMAREWHEVAMLNDDQLAQRIREDRIDILIDLAGRLAGGRPLLLARKPAPILINWIGYTGSLGLSAVDYIIADQHHIPPEAEPFYSEKVLRLRDGHMCFAPPDEAPEVVPPPVLQRGYITLGSFNNPGKVNAQVVEVWAQMLREIPNSKLLLKYRNFDDVATKAHFESQFQRHGIEPSRLMFEGVSPYREMLARYGDVDIALDPFPFTGGMTTCLALWMGCPVVTWPRDTFASRQSLSYLSVIGLPQLIAQSRDEYVQKVVDLSRDVSELESLRREIRPQMASSPFCDRGRFTRDLETKWRAIWRDWVSTEKSEA